MTVLIFFISIFFYQLLSLDDLYDYFTFNIYNIKKCENGHNLNLHKYTKLDFCDRGNLNS